MRPNHEIVSREEWLTARKALLAMEKEETKLRDKVRAERLTLPWVKVDKTYTFETPDGRKTLAELFGGRSQLIVYHFMYGPEWEAGCPGCSFMADHIDGMLPHLNNHDVTMIAVSRAPLEKLTAYKKRMGWTFPWVSSFGSDFNFDYHVSFTKEELASGKVMYNYRETPTADAHDELPGLSAFARDEDGTVYHTYSDYARGGEEALGTLMILDRAPKGRNETGTLSFVKRKDEYVEAPKTHSCCD
ncbi:thioredoxin family protein [Shinella curvata]|uniref:Thioredoxin family protein n=1 Tax=Shinella curvata TaxID=1817964 RepID=A0ABT8XDV4_9HYPH|nr:thioredoxin family protein [Shinella curvata]MCJ8055517.1 thioredoxin family protein [Shinella curvata]MDO6121934.1 thioredoxin family protein [Shinella curvata]